MKKRILPMLISLLLLTGCGGNSADGYQQITQEEAKEMMDTQEVIILDVREQDEYDSGHIPGAVLLPVGSIDEDTAAEVIPEKDSTVLVYCRSGNMFFSFLSSSCYYSAPMCACLAPMQLNIIP